MRLLLLTCLLILAACAAPQNTGNMKAAEPPPAMEPVAKSGTIPPATEIADKSADSAKPAVVDFSCKTDSDCKIKDVGSCCGYRPACVNKDSRTSPAEVKAQCEKEGKMGICGFPSISSCTCNNNRCEGVTGSDSGEKIQ